MARNTRTGNFTTEKVTEEMICELIETVPSDKERARKRLDNAKNDKRTPKDKHRSRDKSRTIRGFIGVDGEGMRTRCTESGCRCARYVLPVFSDDDIRQAKEAGTETWPCDKCSHDEDSHYHAYVLFGVGNQQIDTEMLGVSELAWEHIFEFLYREFSKPANRYKVFCGFFLSYDFTEFFKGLPKNKAWQLFNADGNLHDESVRKGKSDKRPVNVLKPTISPRRTPHKSKPYPVAITGERGSWEIDTLDGRQMRLRPFNCGCEIREYHQEQCPLPGCPADHHLRKQFCHWEDKTVHEPEWMYVNDDGSFFQKSFLSVIDPEDWYDRRCPACVAMPCNPHKTPGCTTCKPHKRRPGCEEHRIVSPEEYELIRNGKERRAVAVLDDTMREYNIRENLILSRVMLKLQEGLTHFGIKLRIDQWYGPGQAAGEWIAQQGRNMPCARDLDENGRIINPLKRAEPKDYLSKIVEHAARASYVGGWFELFAHGRVPGTTYEYDINSAYPHIIRNLPCMAHGKWKNDFLTGTYSKNRPLPKLPKGAEFQIVHATVTGSDLHIGAMLHRGDDGNIHRPHRTHSWYWRDELEAAMSAGLIDTIEIGCYEKVETKAGSEHRSYLCKDWYEYGQNTVLTYFPDATCTRPLAGMTYLYNERLKVGKNTPMGKAAKIVYNSVYGKFAQLIGSPQWGNNIYASRITSGCRKMILEAIATHPQGSADVVMIATDGIYFKHEHPSLPLSDKELGLWDVDTKENLTLFKPGVYWDDKTRSDIDEGKAPQFKSRGVNARQMAKRIGEIDDKFSTWGDTFPQDRASWPTYDIPVGFAQTSCKQALMQGKWETEAGKVTVSGVIKQDSFPDGKRSHDFTDPMTQERVKIAQRIHGYYDPEFRLYRSRPLDMDTGYIVSKPRDEYQTSAYAKDNRDTGIDWSNTPDGNVGDIQSWAHGLKG